VLLITRDAIWEALYNISEFGNASSGAPFGVLEFELQKMDLHDGHSNSTNCLHSLRTYTDIHSASNSEFSMNGATLDATLVVDSFDSIF
jgi:hypothetical protein